MKAIPLKIVLIGAGNVATHLGLALLAAKHNIVQVYSRQEASSKSLARLLKTKHTTAINELSTDADVYILAVKDDAIKTVVKQLHLKNKILVHTSGSVDMDVLKSSSSNYGVFYPLQTFSKSKKVNFENVPICLEANNIKTFKQLELLAKSISNNIQKVNSQQRTNIHIAAVFACNFSNHMFSIADELLKANKLSLDLIKPLIAETAEKIKNNPPAKMQTGPAIRGDKKTMAKHLKMLENKQYKELYKMLSRSIGGK